LRGGMIHTEYTDYLKNQSYCLIIVVLPER